jgi:hypothetical protein
MYKKIIFYVIIIVSCGCPSELFSQPNTLPGNSVETVRNNFIKNLKRLSADSAIIPSLANYFESEINSLENYISHSNLSTLEKDKAKRSLVYFMKELNSNLTRRTLDVYDIPGAIHAYQSVLKAVLMNQPVKPVLQMVGPNRSQLMASTFSQYQQYALLADIAVYKRVSSSPEFILQFLEDKPAFRFSDSLLLDAAVYDPLKIAYYLNRPQTGVQDKIRKNGNIYLRAIADISAEKDASELLPFVKKIAEGRMNLPEIREKRLETQVYFELLVNSLQQAVSDDADPALLKPLRNGIKQKALSFYVSELNDRHSEPEAARFSSVKGLRPQDLYYIITSCGEELYTSSFLGLYKRMMTPFAATTADSLLDIIQYDNYRAFTRLAANYNVLGDFLDHLSPTRKKELLARFITAIEQDEHIALERAMDIADAIAALAPGSEGSELIEAELQSNLMRCTQVQHYLGIRLYSILLDVFNQVKQKDGMSKLWATLGDYETLKHAALPNEKGEIVEAVLFYGDEDGVTSFNNFMRLFNDKLQWEVVKNENWVMIRSLTGKPLVIYANLPLDIKEELDGKAQDALFAHLKEQSLQPSILIHRGHSYHLDRTMKRLTPFVKLAILGSCGGYNKAISIASINPDVQVIGSKKTGAGSVNDPMIDAINRTLLGGTDISWNTVWSDLSKRFSKEGSLSLFNEYFPPSNNLGLFVLKLYNYYNRSL